MRGRGLLLSKESNDVYLTEIVRKEASHLVSQKNEHAVTHLQAL